MPAADRASSANVYRDRKAAGGVRLAVSAATLAGFALGAAPALAQQQQQPAQQRQQQQAQPAQQQQRQGAQQQQGAGQQPKVVNRTDTSPNLLVLILPDVEQRMRPEERARPVTAEELYRGIRASRLMDQDVYGPNGDQLGEVQDVFVDAEGRVTRIIVEAGGFLDIGDAAFSVDWKDVSLTPGREGVQVPITETTAERFGLFDGPETTATGPREFRLSELTGDYVRLRNGVGYGRVSDVVIGRDGRVLGVLVNRDIGWGAGVYGYPFYGYGYGFEPGANFYALPFATAEEAARAPRIESRRFESGVL